MRSWRGKTGIGISRFLPRENGKQATETGIWSLGMEKKWKTFKNGNWIGFEHCEVEFLKKLGLENRIGIIPSGFPTIAPLSFFYLRHCFYITSHPSSRRDQLCLLLKKKKKLPLLFFLRCHWVSNVNKITLKKSFVYKHVNIFIKVFASSIVKNKCYLVNEKKVLHWSIIAPTCLVLITLLIWPKLNGRSLSIVVKF